MQGTHETISTLASSSESTSKSCLRWGFEPHRKLLLEGDHATLRGQLRETYGIGELRLQLRKIVLSHPTGDRARASDVHRYIEVP